MNYEHKNTGTEAIQANPSNCVQTLIKNTEYCRHCGHPVYSVASWHPKIRC
jgi:hypothetical protein